METSVIKATLCGYISSDLLGGMAVGPQDELLLSDLLESLAVVRLVAFMEDTWGIAVPPDDVVLDTIQSVKAMTPYLVDTHKVGA